MILLLHDAGDDVALAIGVLAERDVALGLAEALQDHLLGGLRGDAPEVLGRVLPLLEDRDLFGLRVDLDVLGEDRDLAIVVDDRARVTDLEVRVRHAQIGARERLLDRFDERLERDTPLAFELAQRIHRDLHLLRPPFENRSCRLDLVVRNLDRLSRPSYSWRTAVVRLGERSLDAVAVGHELARRLDDDLPCRPRAGNAPAT